jgi:hypothetical protein
VGVWRRRDSASLFLLLCNRSQLVRSTYLAGLGRGRGWGDRVYVLTIEIVFNILYNVLGKEP